MHEQDVLDLLRQKVAFMGTVSGITPKVRPMATYVDGAGTVWLLSLAQARPVEEISINNLVEVCILGDQCEMLRVNGQLEPAAMDEANLAQLRQASGSLPVLTQTASAANLFIYRLRIHAITFTNKAGVAFFQMEQPGSNINGVLLDLRGSFCLERR